MAEKETKKENKQLPILANGRGLALRSMDDMWRFACAVRDSGLAPSTFQKPEQILIAIQCGAELGMPPLRSLNSFCVIKGAARLWGDAPLALVRQSGLMEYIKEWIEGEGEDMVAYCETKRKGDPHPIKTEFSVEDAKQAGLWNHKDRPTWRLYPKRMLKYRARSFNLRDNFPDAFGGASIAEEFEGVEMPQAVPTPDAGSREDRKQVDAEIIDTKEAIKGQLEKCLRMFVKYAESPVALDRPLDAVPGAMLNELFAKLAAVVLDDKETDYRNIESYTLKNLAQIGAYLENNGIPDEILALIPLPAEEQLQQAEETAKDKLTDYKWRCQCGEMFDKPKGTKKIPICPKCLSKTIIKTESVKTEK